MNEPQVGKKSIIGRMWNAIARGWIAEVPDDIACCEYSCRESHCEQGRWETCEHRLRYMALAEESRNEDAATPSAAGAPYQNPE